MSRCKSCQAEIVWTKTKNDRPTPVNPDGEPHWATCPQRREWRKEPPKQTSFLPDEPEPPVRPRPHYDA